MPGTVGREVFAGTRGHSSMKRVRIGIGAILGEGMKEPRTTYEVQARKTIKSVRSS